MLTFQSYQEQAARTAVVAESINEIHTDRMRSMLYLSYLGLGLSDEAGEVSGKIKKLIRDSEGKLDDISVEMIKQELGDVCWYLSMICSILDIDLENVFRGNLDKLQSRKDRGTIKGSGDKR